MSTRIECFCHGVRVSLGWPWQSSPPLYDKELSVINYAQGAVLQITGTDRAGKAVSNEAMASSVNASNFKVAYGLKAPGADNAF